MLALVHGFRSSKHMKKIDAFTYEVLTNESIVVQVTPINFNANLFSEFTFIAGSPNNAFYDVEISGEDDKGCPCGFKIRKTTANKGPQIEFFVVLNSKHD